MQGAWGYVQGGMGALSAAIASSAAAHGASIFTEKVNGPSSLHPSYWQGSQEGTKPQIQKVPRFTDGQDRVQNQGAQLMHPVSG